MKPLSAVAAPGGNRRAASTSGFTFIELMVASSIGLLVMAGAVMFLQFGGVSLSGITAQAIADHRAGNAIEFIQMHARLATSVSNDSSGNVLTLGFDDNPISDSDGDGTAYNDQDHFEQFKFIGINGSTNTTATNILIYIPKVGGSEQQVLIPAGVHNLPGYKIFTVTNQSTILIRFGIVDGYSRDHYQSVDVQGTAVSLNRQKSSSFINIIP